MSPDLGSVGLVNFVLKLRGNFLKIYFAAANITGLGKSTRRARYTGAYSLESQNAVAGVRAPFNMKLIAGAVPVYTVSGASTARSLPDWLSSRKGRKKNPEDANRIELLQDFGFEEASQCVRTSEDGEWVMSTGTYKPQIHTHYLSNLALSFARHTNTLNKTFIIISSDYSKTVHLQEDRSLEFHTPGGCHHTLRIPRYGRDLVYDRTAAELLVPAVGVNSNGMGEVFRINLEQGKFLKEFEVDVGGDDLVTAGGGALQGGIDAGSVNAAATAEGTHGLYAFGTSLGTVEYWDPRSRARVATLLLPQDYEGRPQVSALQFHRSGISHAVGTSNGLIYVYDLRSPLPTLKKDQGYGHPIQQIEYLTPSSTTRAQTSEPKIMTSDKQIIKIWDERNGAPWTSVEPAVDIHCVAWCRDSGMVLTANEGPQQHAFFIPQLGPAPKWCSFLDNVVEEMADDPNDPQSFTNHKAGEIYDNYKFLTLPQLRVLNLDHHIGNSNLLRPYMHGYFVDQQLYEHARLIANPSSWEQERAKRVQERIDKERESRIRGQKKLVAKVNQSMLDRIQAREAKNAQKRALRAERAATTTQNSNQETPTITAGTESKSETGLLADSRFTALFRDEDFAIDETSREFQALNPSTNPVASNLDRKKGLTAVEQEALDDIPGSSDDESNHSENETDRYRSQARNETISSADYKRRSVSKKQRRQQNDQQQQVQMRVSSSRRDGGSQQRRNGDSSFGSRVNTARDRPARRQGAGVGVAAGVFGEKTITFDANGKGGRRGGDRDRGSIQSGPQRRSGSGNRDGYGSKERRSASGNTFRRM